MNITDTTLLPFQPRKPAQRRPRAAAAAAAAPAPPVLVAAAYDAGSAVTLTFDRPVDVGGMDVVAVEVDDGAVMAFRYRGFGTPTLVDPVTVSVPLTGVEDFSGPGVTLSVAAGNGIVAAGGGAAWAGCAGVALPLP
jgi:hypothetical protein